MTQVIARRVSVETASEDDEGILLFVGGKLVACLVRLADGSHGDLRGHWCIEAAFGHDVVGLPYTFAELADAVAVITQRLTGRTLMLSKPIGTLQ